MEPEGSLPHSQAPITCSFPNLSHVPNLKSFFHILYQSISPSPRTWVMFVTF